MELLEVPSEETEVGARGQTEDQGRLELHPQPTLDIPMINEDPEVIAEREGVHKRIQAEIQHKDQGVEETEEVMLENSTEWNAVPDLIMEDNEGLMITKTNNKQKRDEVAGGCRKWLKEDDIRSEKHEHSPMVSWRTQNPAGFYSGQSLSKKKMKGRRPINGRGFCRWFFVVDVWR